MNSYINFINEGKKSKKRDKRSEIDPYGEEDWDDNGYYILVCLIYEDHFDFIISF